MIKLSDVSFKYSNTCANSVHKISLEIPRGECVLLCGESGCGKTTVTRLINGLIPHFYSGELSGHVTVNNIDILTTELHDIASTVGSVFQNPKSQFFCIDSTSEIAFGCENLGMPVPEITKRIESVTLEMNLTGLLERNIFHLSGGEKQKIAFASVAAIAPDVWVLDEPTANLDIKAISELKGILKRWKAQGKTIIIAEHRLYWLSDLCDRVVYMNAGEIKLDCSMIEFKKLPADYIRQLGLRILSLSEIKSFKKINRSNDFIQLKHFRYYDIINKVPRLNIEELLLPANSIIAIIGDNGAGKSTFAKCLCGLVNGFKGLYQYGETTISAHQFTKESFLVMQDVNHQLFCETVYEELSLGKEVQNTERLDLIMDSLNLKPLLERHPMSLSGGQKQRVAIATALLNSKTMLILDEPTSGLDYLHMAYTADLINTYNSYDNSNTLIISHDPELITRCCNYVLHLDKGSVVDHYRLNECGLRKLLDYFAMC